MLLVVASAVIGAALYFNPGGSRGKSVAYSSPGDANSWFLTFSTELENEAKKRGYSYSVTHAKMNTVKQLADVSDIVAQKPTFLILGPKDTEASADALRSAKKAGVPVIVVNRDIRGKHGVDYITKIYSDFEWIGEKMAEGIHDAFPEGTKIRVVELHGTIGSGNTIGMKKGFRKKIAELGNIEIVKSQPGNFNRSTAMAAMENIIQTNVEFDAVVCHFDSEAMGAIQALRAAGRKFGNDPSKGEIIIVGNGGTKDGLKAVKAGDYHKIVSVSPYYADKVFDAIEAYTKGEKVAEYIRVDDIIIDKNNVDEHMSKGF